MIAVQVCIGCGAVSTPQACLGTCVDRRFELVRADQHAAAGAALARLERDLAERRTLLSKVARSAPAEHEWEALRARARAALRAGDSPVAGDVNTAWACDSCGRIEAPQPCIGVCVRPEISMVEAAEHQAVLTQAAAVERELERLAPPLRHLAWATPKPGHLNDAARAVGAAARALLTLRA